MLAERLGRLGNKEPGGAVVMYGPRGNGKTVLLWELARMADEGKVRHESLRKHMMVGDRDVLAERLAPRKRISLMGIIVRWVKRLMAGGYGLSAGVEFRGPSKIPAWNALHATLQDESVVLTVDEAHEMPADFGQDFLQVAQDFIAAGLPLFVVLAGTPGLPAHLGKMHASFLERSEKLRIGRLETVEVVRDALAIPARDSGMPIDEDALALLVDESQRYPFFVQALGHKSWAAALRRKGTAGRITLEDARGGVAATKEQLLSFYSRRRNEMCEQGVLGEAEAVSKVVFEKGRDARLTGEELMAAVESATPAGVRPPREAVKRLVHLGLVWETADLGWEPGIPSLCRFLVEWEGRPVLG